MSQSFEHLKKKDAYICNFPRKRKSILELILTPEKLGKLLMGRNVTQKEEIQIAQILR